MQQLLQQKKKKEEEKVKVVDLTTINTTVINRGLD